MSKVKTLTLRDRVLADRRLNGPKSWSLAEQEELAILAKSVKNKEMSLAQIQRYMTDHPEKVPECFRMHNRKPYAIIEEIRSMNRKKNRRGRPKKGA